MVLSCSTLCRRPACSASWPHTLSHYMAFAKTPKRIRIAVLSVCIQVKIGLDCQVKKNQKFPISCPTTLFCLNCELSGIHPRSTMELPTNLTNKPNTQVKDYYLFMSMKPFRSAEWWTFIFQNGRNSISDISSPKMGVGNQQSKHHSVEGEISIVQSIQHGFLLSLGSQTSIEANKSTMLRTEWTITASQLQPSCDLFGPNEVSIFCLRTLQAELDFSGARHCKPSNRAYQTYLENISTNWWYIVGFQQGHCCH